MYSNSDKRYNTVITQLLSNISDDICKDVCVHTDNKQQSPDNKQHKLNAIPVHVRTTRIDRVACPLHVIKLTKNLKKIAVSETLKIIVGGQAVESELLSACHSLGHKTLVIENNGHNELFVTRKK